MAASGLATFVAPHFRGGAAFAPAAAWSIAASLMCMIYALGSCSGAHFNPAVTLAIFLSGRGLMSGAGEMAAYMVTQIVAGILAASPRPIT